MSLPYHMVFQTGNKEGCQDGVDLGMKTDFLLDFNSLHSWCITSFVVDFLYTTPKCCVFV